MPMSGEPPKGRSHCWDRVTGPRVIDKSWPIGPNSMLHYWYELLLVSRPLSMRTYLADDNPHGVRSSDQRSPFFESG